MNEKIAQPYKDLTDIESMVRQDLAPILKIKTPLLCRLFSHAVSREHHEKTLRLSRPSMVREVMGSLGVQELGTPCGRKGCTHFEWLFIHGFRPLKDMNQVELANLAFGMSLKRLGDFMIDFSDQQEIDKRVATMTIHQETMCSCTSTFTEPEKQKEEPLESASWMFLTKRIIGGTEDPYLIRHIIIQTPLFSIYVHHLVRSDYERALHDHPWGFISLVLQPYSEISWNQKYTPVQWGRDRWDQPAFGNSSDRGVEKYTRHKKWDILYRPATWRHRVVIEDKAKPGWTLVFTGPRSRWWGFWPEGIWCHWKKFNIALGICESENIKGKEGLN